MDYLRSRGHLRAGEHDRGQIRRGARALRRGLSAVVQSSVAKGRRAGELLHNPPRSGQPVIDVLPTEVVRGRTLARRPDLFAETAFRQAAATRTSPAGMPFRRERRAKQVFRGLPATSSGSSTRYSASVSPGPTLTPTSPSRIPAERLLVGDVVAEEHHRRRLVLVAQDVDRLALVGGDHRELEHGLALGQLRRPRPVPRRVPRRARPPASAGSALRTCRADACGLRVRRSRRAGPAAIVVKLIGDRVRSRRVASMCDGRTRVELGAVAADHGARSTASPTAPAARQGAAGDQGGRRCRAGRTSAIERLGSRARGRASAGLLTIGARVPSKSEVISSRGSVCGPSSASWSSTRKAHPSRSWVCPRRRSAVAPRGSSRLLTSVADGPPGQPGQQVRQPHLGDDPGDVVLVLGRLAVAHRPGEHRVHQLADVVDLARGRGVGEDEARASWPRSAAGCAAWPG